MQPVMVVGDFEKCRQFGAQCIQIAPLSAVHLLLFECLDERLSLGVVVGITHAAHARLHSMIGQQREIVGAGILNAAVGMMNQPRRRLPFEQRHAQRLHGHTRA
jgi:hypothetical protein